ncbi:MAG: HAD hydrolase-like protein [bacterium]
MKKTILLVFDFDGTLADSHEEVLAAMEYSCKKLKLSLPSIEDLRNTPAKDLIKSLKIGPYKIYRMLQYSRSYLKKSSKEVRLYSGMPALLSSLNQNVFHFHVVSTNTQEKILRTLKNEGVGGLFSSVQGSMGLWSKKSALEKLARKNPSSQKIYVGDEERDILAAQDAGFEALSVGWGFKSPELLQGFQPRYFVRHLKQFEALLHSLG